MDPVSQADHLMAVLRRRLVERTRAKAAQPRNHEAPTPRPLGGLHAVAALAEADRDQVRRACIQALLAEQFGQGLINDIEFQQIVSRVADAIGSDEKASLLLDQVIGELRIG